jgi:signal transduction histidine kinase/ActR/RegA family two-component response regulator
MSIRAHLHDVPPITLASHVYEAMDRFRMDRDLRFLPVVHPDGTVAGVLRHEAMRGYLFGMYGYQLVKHHPLIDFISACVTVSIDSSVDTALSIYAAAPTPDGLILVDDGRYAGVLLTGAILMMYEENRIRIQKQMLQSQKMEAIGTLAGGIAHDFNNILMPIMGFGEMLHGLSYLDGLDQSRGKLRSYSEQILKAAGRGRDLVTQILSFSRQHEQETRTFNLGGVVQEVVQLLQASMPSTISIRHHALTSHDTIQADPTQIHQVLMNLCSNAAYAMKDQKGTLDITLSDGIDPKEQPLQSAAQSAHGHVCLAIADSGSGIEPQVLQRIFDPFFTTKPPGAGTGMGLAVVHGIVSGLRGWITVDSVLGQGTCFKIHLPRTAQQPLSTPSESAVEPHPDPAGGRVLVVDDEPSITQLISDYLNQHGYTAVSRNSSMQAFDLVAKNPGHYDLVITDQTMPGMSGLELSKRILQLRGNLPIVILSGFSEQLDATTAADLGFSAYLMKPVSLKRLKQVVAEILANAKAGC